MSSSGKSFIKFFMTEQINLRDGGRGQEGLTFESSADDDGANPGNDFVSEKWQRLCVM